MICFAVHDKSGRAASFMPRHTSVVGKDEMTVPGTVSFEDGLLICRKHTNDAAAVSLQIDSAEAGVLTIQTCLLPDREAPYNLELELARHQIMQLLNKLEEWSLAMLPTDHPVMLKLEQARAQFTRALSMPRREGEDGAAQATMAREALTMGIQAGEDMAQLQAERELAARLNPPEPDLDAEDTSDLLPPPRPPELGCVVPAGQFSEHLQRIISRSFGFVSIPVVWRDIEEYEGKRSFTRSDQWIEWAVRKGKKPVAAGPLLDLRRAALPEWVYIWEHDYKTLRELAYEHLKAVVTRYRRTVTRWSVISGANIGGALSLRIEEMVDLTRLAVLTARKLQPNAKILVELDQPFGEHGTHLDRSLSPVLYAGLVTEAGISIDGFGIRLQMGDGEPGRSCRDLMQLSSVLDTFSKLEKPLHVTAIGAPSDPVPARTPIADSEVESKLADDIGQPGHWRGQWTGARQAEWLARALVLAMGKPFVESVSWQSLYDLGDGEPQEMIYGGLITASGKAKPSLRRITEIATALGARQVPRFGRAENRASQQVAAPSGQASAR